MQVFGSIGARFFRDSGFFLGQWFGLRAFWDACFWIYWCSDLLGHRFLGILVHGFIDAGQLVRGSIGTDQIVRG